jgi:hypothetical protein
MIALPTDPAFGVEGSQRLATSGGAAATSGATTKTGFVIE